MGIIRLLLAISVVLFHTGIGSQWTGTGGTASVQAFYMISGFYISMTLRESYRNAVIRFWINRALRLYPAYFVVVIVTLILRVAFSPEFLQMFRDLPSSARLLVLVSNATVFGQDWILFLGLNNDAVHFVTDYRKSVPQLWMFMLDPPAWSLGIELTFYLIAPLLMRLRLRVLAAIMIASLILRIVLVANGLSFDPWSYRFFPTEIALFIAGALAQHASGPIRYIVKSRSFLGPMAIAIIIGFIAGFPILPGSVALKSVVLYLCLLVCLPVIFDHSRSNKADRYIGDLSYLLYISHWTVVLMMHRLVGNSHSVPAVLGIVVVSIVTAIALGLVIDLPVRRIRSKVRDSARRESALGARNISDAAATHIVPSND
jgi:peptidoglycan/LPS O-acetylase OafA/YrhL